MTNVHSRNEGVDREFHTFIFSAMDDICIQLHAQVLPPTEKDTDAQEYGAKWSI